MVWSGKMERQLQPEEPTALIVNPHSRTGGERFDDVQRALDHELNLVHASMPDNEQEFCARLKHNIRPG